MVSTLDRLLKLGTIWGPPSCDRVQELKLSIYKITGMVSRDSPELIGMARIYRDLIRYKIVVISLVEG